MAIKIIFRQTIKYTSLLNKIINVRTINNGNGVMVYNNKLYRLYTYITYY